MKRIAIALASVMLLTGCAGSGLSKANENAFVSGSGAAIYVKASEPETKAFSLALDKPLPAQLVKSITEASAIAIAFISVTTDVLLVRCNSNLRPCLHHPRQSW